MHIPSVSADELTILPFSRYTQTAVYIRIPQKKPRISV